MFAAAVSADTRATSHLYLHYLSIDSFIERQNLIKDDGRLRKEASFHPTTNKQASTINKQELLQSTTTTQQ